MQMYNGITLITLHVIHNVRKGSIYKNGVVLETKTNLHVYRIWYGISYFQKYYSIPNHTPSISWHHFNPKSIENVFFYKDTKIFVMDTVPNKQTTSISGQPPEDASRYIPLNTAPQTTCHSNPDHVVFLHYSENLK